MLNRRLIRVKVFQAFYAYSQQESDNARTRAYLMRSLEGIEDTFFSVLVFPYEFAHFLDMEFNQSERQYGAESDRKKSARALKTMSVWSTFENSPEIKERINKPRHNWQIDHDFMRLMVKNILSEPFFQEFVEAPDKADNVAFMLQWYEYLCYKNEDFEQQMESIDMHWEDEKIPVMQSIKKLFKDGIQSPLPVPAVSTDWEEDSSFAMDLLDCAIKSDASYTEMIAVCTPDWESERIAKTDLLLMVLALCEFTRFPYIPVKVSMNEYLELAKRYSTPQSSKFVNGVLDKLLKTLQSENKVIKKGRGLLE